MFDKEFEKKAEEYRKDLKSKFFLSEPQLDLACQGFKDGYNKANEWHFIKDCLPPEPECEGDILKPLDYICAYKLKDGDYETDFFSYYGNGEFLGENKEYPIYAWLEHPICVPEPPKEQE